MFYKTNLKYITMFIKCEGELGIDKEERKDKRYFPKDPHITHIKYIEKRYKDYSEQFVGKTKKNNKDNSKKSQTFLRRMNRVFLLFKALFSSVIVIILAFYFLRASELGIYVILN